MFPYPEQYRLAAPPLVTALMVLWSIVSRALFGDDSAIAFYPLFMLFPLNILLHGKLIWQAKGIERLDQSIYAFIHLSLAFVVWTFAIMHVNGHSF
ncbi:hypothetical protein SHLO109777_09680 [Shewanella loihica]|uniref:Uncharacterized protein n=1 Tax=Shewanella loihica (strain ATCC BAA-1088 / PV-4) TaxID=323850 RepID=A3QB08_SHELP|nr:MULTISPECIES: hypothetical protein [Shewanella]ABO22656.1 conserved hypothetical protein [Shewanella loihica PV-4]QYJ83194.1 hypothetical protein K0H80_03985 [Shewanella aegiceratis]QYJ94561.1 hypothetical protein K0I31_04000 [Shewanella spartinae]QYJ98413.1 hypothetical protein K0J45_04005 [Shewanella alkalitolerans]QYK13701.1 hypothetical protein K0I63_04065 [Shewanella rhizosphaerae]